VLGPVRGAVALVGRAGVSELRLLDVERRVEEGRDGPSALEARGSPGVVEVEMRKDERVHVLRLDPEAFEGAGERRRGIDRVVPPGLFIPPLAEAALDDRRKAIAL